MTEAQTVAHLKENTPFNHIFPNGNVPIVSLLPKDPQ